MNTREGHVHTLFKHTNTKLFFFLPDKTLKAQILIISLFANSLSVSCSCIVCIRIFGSSLHIHSTYRNLADPIHT